MAVLTQFSKSGNSLAVRLPKRLIEALKIKAGEARAPVRKADDLQSLLVSDNFLDAQLLPAETAAINTATASVWARLPSAPSPLG